MQTTTSPTSSKQVELLEASPRSKTPPANKTPPPLDMASLIVISLMMLSNVGWSPPRRPGLSMLVKGVSVQKLSVPDLVVIDQLNQPQLHPSIPYQGRLFSDFQLKNSNVSSQPEAQSLINGNQDLNHSHDLTQPQITFQCLISYDKRKDRNLIIKWHHDDKAETIYQWIPELNKRSIAPQYRAYIAPIVPSSNELLTAIGFNQTSSPGPNALNQTQLLEAGFKLLRPTKELGGKYQCSAISAQNEDSKWKKMIVYTPPRYFRFNASRTDIGVELASQRDRLIQLSQSSPLLGSSTTLTSNSQLPLAYRMKTGLENFHSVPTSTLSPQMYSTIDYVNVNQQHRQQQQQQLPWSSRTVNLAQPLGQQSIFSYQDQLKQQSLNKQPRYSQRGVKLVCDIDQVFPVPEVSIYRLAKLDGSHPDKLAKLDTKIERNVMTGLYHVQVTSILEDDELQMKYGLNEPVYFECLIALTNLELSKYADNKRSIVYRPGLLTSASNQLTGLPATDESTAETAGNSASSPYTLESWIIHPLFRLSLTLITWWALSRHHLRLYSSMQM